uniref:Putative transposable element n=1 Tax=Ixodes ricinus TaxID=34613 RepID=A0A0K8RM45_IXORI
MKNFKLVECMLCTTELDKESKKTGENIRSAVLQALRSFDLQDCFTNLAFVTDRGTNVISTLKSQVRLHCAAHILNTVLETTTPTDQRDDATALSDLLPACRSLVTFFKRSGLQCRL